MDRRLDLEPMLARSATDLPADAERWAFEVKWDGFRALVHALGRRVHLRSRKGRDLTPLFPELQVLAPLLVEGTIVDGEIVLFGAGGRPDFEGLQGRLGLSGRSLAEAAAAKPVRLVAYDIPYDGGRSLIARPYLERRGRLEALEVASPQWWTPPAHLGEGAALQKVTRELALEGIVAKRLDSRYEPGRRTGAWRKIKNWQSAVLEIGGWVRASDGGPGTVLLGERQGEGLCFVAAAQIGLFGEVRRALAQVLPELERNEMPFTARPRVPGARFVEPLLRVRCQYLERTSNGRIRHASILGLVLPEGRASGT